jgi:PAS domain S-box-containing protein
VYGGGWTLVNLSLFHVSFTGDSSDWRPMSAAAESPQELAAIHATEPLLVTDSERVVFVNQAFANLVGVPLGDIVDRGIDQIITILGEPMVVDRLKSALRQHQSFRGEASCHTAGGGSVPVDLTVIPVASGDRELFVVSAHDLRRQKRLEHQLWQSQRLDALTQLADGIAHGMNEAIQVMSGYANLSAPDPGPRQLTGDDLAALERAARRASYLLTELLEFARPSPPMRTPVDLSAVIGQWEPLLHPLIGTHIRLIVDLGRDLPLVLADAKEIHQILINLVTNARDAMADGGTLTISTHLVEPDHALDHGDLDEQLGRYVILTVTDTGVGMSADIKANLFQPFFSTKGGPGTRGLGMATVQEIVRETGGLLWVRSQPQQGTSVEVHFPALAQPNIPPPAPAARAPRFGNETILLVDDDPGVLKVSQRVLERFGYRVVTAASAAEATTYAAERGAEISLLVTDVMMPGQRGTGLAQELLAEWPHLRVLFISGHPSEEVAQMARKAPYLNKPFTSEDLGRAVRAAFDS